MAYNGSGAYALYTPGNPVVSGTTIDVSWGNNTLNDIATALSTCITKDGQTTTTASIPFVVGIAVTTGITTPSTTFALVNTTATTVNFAGGATTAINIGGAGNTTTWTATSFALSGNLTVSGGAVGIGTAAAADYGLNIVVTTTTNADQDGIRLLPTFNSSATGSGHGILSNPNTAAAAFTCPLVTGFRANNAGLGAGSTITRNVGFSAEAMSGGTTNIAFEGNSATPNYNLYMGTSGLNFLSSGVRIGADSSNNLIDDASNGAASTTLYIGNASINVTSDERLKHNRVPLKDGLGIVRALLPIEFDQDEARPWGSVQHYVGFGARHSHKIAPWSVNTQGDTELPWQMRQEFLMAPAVRAIQQIDERLAALEAQLAA